ncbi:uncharacterized protein LOC126973557 [Leptidea sinapis]|uniref:uncharacterized protein LOC126973557 n=1 Tax=Leptidea sinapis TaxID=189913 RepID=UPI0021C45702|nr:uncharacterized protein LOC126973557 [Leptidea sinapis]
MSDADIDLFISLVQERPCLWDSSDETYKDKFMKQEARKSICEIIYENYNEKDATEKSKLDNTFPSGYHTSAPGCSSTELRTASSSEIHYEPSNQQRQINSPFTLRETTATSNDTQDEEFDFS